MRPPAALGWLPGGLEVDGRAALERRPVVPEELELGLAVFLEDSGVGEEVVLGLVAGLEGRRRLLGVLRPLLEGGRVPLGPAGERRRRAGWPLGPTRRALTVSNFVLLADVNPKLEIY